MKKILIVLILFTSLKNYSQEIQFVKEYDKVNYKDTDGYKIDKLAKSYVYFYNKGKVKVKIINSINLTIFLTEIIEKELVGVKTTFFKGIDNKENKIRGFYTDKSFSILSDTSTLILNKKEEIETQNSLTKNLLKEYFSISKYKSEKIAYLSDNKYEVVEFHNIKKYIIENKEYSIIIFSLHNVYDKDKYTRANEGDIKFSVIKLEKKNDNWEFLNRWDNLDIGYESFGKLFVPEIIDVKGFIFLELKNAQYWGQGLTKYSEIFNINNFKRSFITFSGNFDENIEEYIISQNKFVKEQIEEYSDNYTPSASDGVSNNQEYSFITRDNKLILINREKYAEYDEKLKIWKKIEKDIIYIYNPETFLFERQEKQN